jgi:CRP-like cAMP-binding protein
MKYYTRQIKKYQQGDIIFTENSACDGMYIVDSGRVRVFKTIRTGKTLKEVELCILGSKAMFGEMAMIDESKRSASVQALEPTACTIISKTIFEDQLSRIPPWMVNMIKILVSRLRETNEKLRKIVEEQTSVNLDADTGFLTVNGVDGSKDRPGSMGSSGNPKALQSELIIKDLFENAHKKAL